MVVLEGNFVDAQSWNSGLCIQSDGRLDLRVCFDVPLYCKYVLFKF